MHGSKESEAWNLNMRAYGEGKLRSCEAKVF